MPTLLSERLRIIAAALVASVLMLLTSRPYVLGSYFALVNWCPVAVLIVPKRYRFDFITAMLSVLFFLFLLPYANQLAGVLGYE